MSLMSFLILQMDRCEWEDIHVQCSFTSVLTFKLLTYIQHEALHRCVTLAYMLDNIAQLFPLFAIICDLHVCMCGLSGEAVYLSLQIHTLYAAIAIYTKYTIAFQCDLLQYQCLETEFSSSPFTIGSCKSYLHLHKYYVVTGSSLGVARTSKVVFEYYSYRRCSSILGGLGGLARVCIIMQIRCACAMPMD